MTGAETPLVMTDPVKPEVIEARFDEMERRLAELEAERHGPLPSGSRKRRHQGKT